MAEIKTDEMDEYDEWRRLPEPMPEHVSRLVCGCPLDSGCDGYHSIADGR